MAAVWAGGPPLDGAHPQAVTAMEVLERAGQAETVRARLLKILEASNESQDAFQVTSHYVVAVARRPTRQATLPAEQPGPEG